MKKPALLSAVLLFSLLLSAHEFWLQPQKFYFTIREMARVRFLVGEKLAGKNWEGSPEKIASLIHYAPSGNLYDLKMQVTKKGDSLQIPLAEEGTHMLVFNSTNSFIQLDAPEFNAYLREEGLQNVLRYRTRHGEDKMPGKEYYQRSVKTVFQAGSKITDSCLLPTTLPLDILPVENPYMVPFGTNSEKPVRVKFQVIFNGQPLNDLLVKCSYYRGTARLEDTGRTNRRGFISFDRHPGPNLISCVYMERNQADTAAQWQSYWGSLSFEYSQFFPGKTGSLNRTPRTKP